MKIVFVTYNYSKEFNCPEKWLHRIRAFIGILEYLGKKHTVISIEQINYEGELFRNDVHYIFLNYKNNKSYFPVQLHNFIKKQAPDIVFINGLHYPVQVLQLRIHLEKTVKIIGLHHAEKPFNWPRNYLQKIADKCISAYMFTSVEMAKAWIEKGIIANNRKIWGIMEASSIFNPVNKQLSKQKTGVNDNLVFLWVGRLNENKDPLTVLKAFLQFTKYNSEARLYMIYHTTELLDEILKLITEEDPDKCVVLIGKVPHDEMLYWYNSTDFIISGSHYEGSGVAVCEAMSCGCIPILTNIPSFSMMTKNGKCGKLYNAGDEVALLNALLETEKMNIGEEQKKVLEQFNAQLSFNAIAKHIDAHISSLFLSNI